MRLLEYQSKDILSRYGIPVPKGKLISTSIDQCPLPFPVVIKAQIPSGGRKKAGGVIECRDQNEFAKSVKQLFRNPLRGYPVGKILVEDKVDISHEFYLGVIHDTIAKEPVAIFTTEGGIEVEKLAEQSPEKVKKRHFSVTKGLAEFEAREMISEAGVTGKTLLGLSNILSRLTQIFLRYDCTVAEINPLVETHHGQRIALDCHLEIDDDALFRQSKIRELTQENAEIEGGRPRTEFEIKAREIDSLDQRGVAGRLIEFDGNLGLIIGGGGASLTAFDAIQRHGGKPANYCEIGGNPSVLKTKELTKHILSKPGVKKIAIIMNVVSNTRVDLMARGVIKGILELGKDPAETVAVFRVPGAWEEEGYKILSKYGITYCDRSVSIDEAARIAVEKIRPPARTRQHELKK